MSSVSVSKASKWFSSKNKSFKLISHLPGRLKRSFSSSSSSSSSYPRTTTTVSSPSSLVSSRLSLKERTKKEDVFKEVFQYLDRDGDGKISSLELRTYFVSIGEHMSDEEAQSVIDDLDSDGDGLLDYKDFMVSMKQSLPISQGNSSSSSNNGVLGGEVRDDEEDIRKAFEMFESEKGSGCITPKSLQRMLNRLGDVKSYEQCVTMIQVFDLDSNGILDFHEFHKMMA